MLAQLHASYISLVASVLKVRKQNLRHVWTTVGVKEGHSVNLVLDEVLLCKININV